LPKEKNQGKGKDLGEDMLRTVKTEENFLAMGKMRWGTRKGFSKGKSVKEGK